MKHSLLLICSCKMMMIFTGAIFLLISLDMALGVPYNYSIVTMPLNNEQVITSPGYPHTDYERDTNYTWYVVAEDAVEIIFIKITMKIHRTPGFSCDDYLQIQEIQSLARRFTVFKRCGQHTTNITTRGNRLLITLISNDDRLTSKGFQLTLKVAKVGPKITAKTTSTQSTTTQSTTTVPTKTTTTASTVKTKVSKARSTKSTLTKRTIPTSTLLPSTVEPLKASTVKILMSNTTTPTITTTQPTTSTTPLTTRKMITTIPNMALTTNATTLLTKSMTLLTSTQTASTIRTTDENIATESNKESTTIWLSSSQSVEMRSTLYDRSTTKTQPKQSSTSGTRNITTPMDTATGKDASSFWNIFGSFETVILLIGLGVLEVTLIVVGVLAVQRYRQKRNSNPSRHASKRIDDDANTLKRQNSFGETNVYDEINIDDVKEEKEENPYKELPEGVYDTTLKRRSYLKVVGERKSNYSRGSIINMFRTSSFFKRKVNETSVMTFSSFKGPIQSQIGEKSNQ